MEKLVQLLCGVRDFIDRNEQSFMKPTNWCHKKRFFIQENVIEFLEIKRIGNGWFSFQPYEHHNKMNKTAFMASQYLLFYELKFSLNVVGMHYYYYYTMNAYKLIVYRAHSCFPTFYVFISDFWIFVVFACWIFTHTH